MFIQNEWNIFTLEELVNFYLPNVIYIKENLDHKQKLSNIIQAYLNGIWDIKIDNDFWYLRFNIR